MFSGSVRSKSSYALAAAARAPKSSPPNFRFKRTLPILPKSSLRFTSTRLSSPQKPSQGAHVKPDEVIQGAKFSELGATKTVKIVIIICLCIAGTMETIFWTRVLWEKFGPAKEEGGGASNDAA